MDCCRKKYGSSLGYFVWIICDLLVQQSSEIVIFMLYWTYLEINNYTYSMYLRKTFEIRLFIMRFVGERSGSAVECLTCDRGVGGSSRTGVTVLCPSARHINPCLVPVHIISCLWE